MLLRWMRRFDGCLRPASGVPLLGLVLAGCGLSALEGLSEQREVVASRDGGAGGAKHAGGAAGQGGSGGGYAGAGGAGAGEAGARGTGGASADGGPDAPVTDGGGGATDAPAPTYDGGSVGTSCAALRAAGVTTDGVYPMDPDGPGGQKPFASFCSMSDPRGGGWTLILKIDGNATTFAYDAALWTNADTFNADQPDFNRVEAKLAGFATMPFTQLLVGMVDAEVPRWIVVPITGASFLGLMTTTSLDDAGTPTSYVPTSAGREAWRSLLASPSLQPYCDMEGFNMAPLNPLTPGTLPSSEVRFGLLANDKTTCYTPDSSIGFGIIRRGSALTLASGNIATADSDNGIRMTPTFGYVLVR